MRVGIVSDTHGHVELTRPAVRMFESLEVDRVLHCGDIGSTEVVELFAAWPTDFVFGNCDSIKSRFAPRSSEPDKRVTANLANSNSKASVSHSCTATSGAGLPRPSIAGATSRLLRPHARCGDRTARRNAGDQSRRDLPGQSALHRGGRIAGAQGDDCRALVIVRNQPASRRSIRFIGRIISASSVW